MITVIDRVRVIINQVYDKLRYPKPSETFEHFGTKYGGWWVETAGLNEKSSVISAGIGEDISFDVALIHNFGCQIFAFDPTPKAIAYVAQSQTEPKFIFEACALAREDGTIDLIPPKNPEYASYTIADTASGQGFTFPAKSLRTILAETGCVEIDLLKMDIEGSEYAVIDSIIADQLVVKQLCVEFHDSIAVEIGRSTKNSIKQLADYGLKLVYKSYDNYTFVSQKACL